MLEITSFILVVFGLSVLIIIHEAGHFFVAKFFGLLVEEFGFGLPPRFWSKKIGETIYSFNWLPFGGFVKIFGERKEAEISLDSIRQPQSPDLNRAFYNQAVWKRVLIVVAGVTMNFLLGWLLISSVLAVGIPQSVLVAEVQKGGIADLAGIKAGDQIYEFKTVQEFKEYLDLNSGWQIILKVRRGDEYLDILVTPRLAVPEGEGNLGIFLVETGLPKLGPLGGLVEGLKLSINMIVAIFFGFVDLFVGVFTDISILDRFIGPVGIVNVAVQTTKQGLVYFLQLLAMISFNLAVFNIIPIPALDGGRLLFLAIEKLRGRPMVFKTEAMVNALSFGFLLFLILVITIKDLLKLF